jgi:hypothetical protein
MVRVRRRSKRLSKSQSLRKLSKISRRRSSRRRSRRRSSGKRSSRRRSSGRRSSGRRRSRRKSSRRKRSSRRRSSRRKRSLRRRSSRKKSSPKSKKGKKTKWIEPETLDVKTPSSNITLKKLALLRNDIVVITEKNPEFKKLKEIWWKEIKEQVNKFYYLDDKNFLGYLTYNKKIQGYIGTTRSAVFALIGKVLADNYKISGYPIMALARTPEERGIYHAYHFEFDNNKGKSSEYWFTGTLKELHLT